LGNDETVHYFDDLDEVQKFKDANSDLYGDAEAKEKSDKPKNQTRRAVEADLHLESKAIADCWANFPRKGWPWIITRRRTSRCMN
jgi:hypothetical protein